ncbi:MAG TPA: dihydrolipoyl dehydrogenase, partial [Coriobacteriia bacterium]|nr:dihydrolipoyl dehydrogenase [Coriobacteriia bacterium]
MRIVVLGGGPGGYAAAFEAARLGADVTLVERARLGGTCLHRGCIPTKAMMRSARLAAEICRAGEYGIGVSEAIVEARVDPVRLRVRAAGVIDELTAQLEASARRLRVRTVRGEGRLVSPLTVEVASAEGDAERLEGDAVILATGSLPVLLPGIDHGLSRVWTSDEALALSEIPREAVIVGAGVIGLEFACAYAAFGGAVTVVELTSQVLPGNDRRLVRAAQAALEARGVRFVLGDAVASVEQRGERVRAGLRSGASLEADVLLSAPGRLPASGGLGLEEAGVATNRAAVVVDEYFRASVPGVYAVGDVIGGMMLAHVAEEEGVVAARNAVAEFATVRAAPRLETVRYDCMPACVYTFPEIAVVGMTRDAVTAAGGEAVQAVAKFTANGKALGEGEAEGFVQLVAEKSTGAILGCQIIGPHAVEIVHEVAVSMRHGIGVRGLAETVHAHPTVSEVVRAAALDAAAKCR